jgi:glutamyl-tRNA reductase
MYISLIGITHKTAPVTVREKIGINNDSLPEALSKLGNFLPQGIILSTCNRTEIYTACESEDAEKACLKFLGARLNIQGKELGQYIYSARDGAAVEHLFRVASGLESMIVGEYEVLGQVRQSLEAAEKANMVNLALRHIFNAAIRVGRDVREKTGISKDALSVSSVAVDLAAKAVGDLTGRKIMVIGAGEAGRLVAKVARERGASKILIASRTRQRAQVLAANLKGTPICLNELDSELKDTDIVVTCAGSPHRILTTQQIEGSMKERPDLPLVIIDIAVPRNVEPEIKGLKNVFLYNLDDLTDISKTNRKRREGSIQKAERIIAKEVNKFIDWWQDFEVRPTVSALMSKAERIRSTQLNKTLKMLPPLSGEQLENLDAMTKSIVTRILHDPIQYLKTNEDNGHSELVKELFRLDMENC